MFTFTVPSWASECTFNAMPSVTIQYMSDTGTIQLSRDCGEEGTRHIACRGKSDRERILKDLICNDDNVAIVSDTNKIAVEATMADKKKLDDNLSHFSSDNNEDNHIDKHLNDISHVSDDKISSKLSLEDMMLGDQPVQDFDELKKIKEKKVNIKFDKKKVKNLKEKVNEEMMGDQPLSMTSPQEFLPHTKKYLPEDLKKKSDVKAPTVSTEADNYDVIISQSTTFVPQKVNNELNVNGSTQSYITSTTTIVSTTTDQRMRRHLEVVSSTESTTESENISSHSPNYDTNSALTEVTESEPTEPSDETTQQPRTTEFHEGGRKSGHPIHIPYELLMKNDKSTTTSSVQKSTIAIPTPRPTQRRDLGEDHFIPPMLLVKSQFTTKIHSDSGHSMTPTISPSSSTTSDIIIDDSNTESPFIIDDIEMVERLPVSMNLTSPTAHDIELTDATIASSISEHNELPFSSETHTSVIVTTNNANIDNELEKNIYNDNEAESTHHPDHENIFSNAENFQPYRPNRHRQLTKPETQSMIKKILG